MDLIDLRIYKDENAGYSSILNIVDVFSKFCISNKLKSQYKEEVVGHLEAIFYLFGNPTILQSDKGKEFKIR
jgi:hypothetical protein